jgi:hypothetical protein
MQRTNQDSSLRFWLLFGLVLAAVSCRLMPPMVNFAPVGAIALFGGACFSSRRAAFLVPFAVMLLGDTILNLTRYSATPAMSWSMSAMNLLPFVLIVCLGLTLRTKTRSVSWLFGGALGASAIFFVVSNFIWYLTPWNVESLATCYVRAIPFIRGTLISDALFTTLLFGMLAFVESKVPGAKPQLAEVRVEN